MREIKFRAWDKVNKRMDKLFSLESDGKSFYDYETDCASDRILSRDKPLMQYTGLKDKNGKEIYEGDLLEAKEYWGEKDYAEVYWNVKRAEFRLKRKGNDYEQLGSCFADGHCVWKVIGNIHENSELLEVKK